MQTCALKDTRRRTLRTAMHAHPAAPRSSWREGPEEPLGKKFKSVPPGGEEAGQDGRPARPHKTFPKARQVRTRGEGAEGQGALGLFVLSTLSYFGNLLF